MVAEFITGLIILLVTAIIYPLVVAIYKGVLPISIGILLSLAVITSGLLIGFYLSIEMIPAFLIGVFFAEILILLGIPILYRE